MKNRQARILRWALAAFVAVCGQTAWAADVVFGQVASQSNPASAPNAKGMTAGIQAYFESVNARGGINGNRLVLKTLDDGLNASKFVELTKELVADKNVVGIVGSLNSAGLAAITKDNIPGTGKIALIAPLQGDKPIITSSNVFPLRSGYADEIRSLLADAKTWGKNELAIMNMNVAFGPGFAEIASTMAGEMGLKVVSRVVVDASSPEKMAESIRSGMVNLEQANPKAVIVLAAGKPATDFLRALKVSRVGTTQIYGVSVMLHTVVADAIGKDKARGIIISQATPYPYTLSKPVITEYQNAMKKHMPNEPISFTSLEGYMGAKIAAEAVRRAGSSPTREKVLAALQQFGEYDLGGLFVSYRGDVRKGWGGVEMTIINASGNLQK
jgi:ABC-type branched-subunit amino acid transport system substrate-binding protein